MKKIIDREVEMIDVHFLQTTADIQADPCIFLQCTDVS
jgi:hypothetical protein